MNLKEIHYGIEIETVKRTREQIAWAIHSVVGGTVRHVGIPSSYDPWEVEDLRGKVSCWKNSHQKHRWLAAALVDIEPRLRTVQGYRHLKALREAIQRELKIESSMTEAA